MCIKKTNEPDRLTGPHAPTPEQELPHALVFFLSRGQRLLVLRTLKEIHETREIALLRALGVHQ
ncbi:MAG: hypothetical protein KC996_02780 [Phycisphaerales bacterium]|nr:hypothetical protein [Phycisphaerales bacterium]